MNANGKGPGNGPESTALGSGELEGVLYGELRGLARRYLVGERANHTLAPTELVHEAWLRLARARGLSSEDRSRFRRLAARTMRRVLVDHARARLADRRRADRQVPLLEEPALELEWGAELEPLDRSLEALQAVDERLAQVVELRFFGGLSVEETAQTLGISARTVKREWRLARAWLHRRVQGELDG